MKISNKSIALNRRQSRRWSLKKVQLLVIVVLTVGVYLNTLPNKFVWDDKTFSQWEVTRSFANLDIILRGYLPDVHQGDYRPLKGIILTVDNALFGQNPFYYHIQAILIHLSATLLAYLLLREILGKFGSSFSGWVAFLAAIIFGVHPIHTEAITFVTSSTDMVGASFFFGAIYLYIRATKQHRGRRVKLFWSTVLGFFSFVAYEATLVLPFLILLYDMTFGEMGKKNLRKYLRVYLLYFGIFCLYIILRFGILRVFESNLRLEDSLYLTMLAMVRVFWMYWQLTVWPYFLTVNHQVLPGLLALTYADYSREAFMAQKIWEAGFLWAFFANLTIAGAGIWALKRMPVLGFSIFWFYLNLAAFANILPLNNLMTERYLYIPSLGWCFLLAYLVVKGVGFGGRLVSGGNVLLGTAVKINVVCAFVVLVLVYSYSTVARNFDWRDSLTLWTKTLEGDSNMVIGHHNVGVYYFELGDFKTAIAELEIAEKFNRKSRRIPQLAYHLGSAYGKSGNNLLAVYYYEKAIEYNSEYSEPYLALGNYYWSQKDLPTAEGYYKKALEHNPVIFQAYINLGAIYADRKDDKLALENFKKARAMNPYSYESFFNIGSIYLRYNNLDLAKKELLRGLRYNPGNSELLEKLKALSEASAGAGI